MRLVLRSCLFNAIEGTAAVGPTTKNKQRGAARTLYWHQYGADLALRTGEGQCRDTLNSPDGREQFFDASATTFTREVSWV
jgi:hypothetical protein